MDTQTLAIIVLLGTFICAIFVSLFCDNSLAEKTGPTEISVSPVCSAKYALVWENHALHVH